VISMNNQLSEHRNETNGKHQSILGEDTSSQPGYRHQQPFSHPLKMGKPNSHFVTTTVQLA